MTGTGFCAHCGTRLAADAPSMWWCGPSCLMHWQCRANELDVCAALAPTGEIDRADRERCASGWLRNLGAVA